MIPTTDRSAATLRRIVYTASPESRDADTITALRDPEIELARVPATKESNSSCWK